MFYEPSSGHGLPHDPFKAIVAPRPIGWISTRAKDGSLNLAPYSFFNALSSKPPLVWFSSDGGKDSDVFAVESGEFVVNLAGRDFAGAMNASSVNAPRGVSEFGYAGLKAVPSVLVSAPRVAGVAAALECKVTEAFVPRGLDGVKIEAVVVMGEVVGVYIDDAMLTDGIFDIVKAGNLARLGYMDYSSVDAIFQMRRPKWEE